MNKPVLSNPDTFPDDKILQTYLKKTKPFLDLLLKSIEDDYPKAEQQWKFYNDGKSWLSRFVRLKKTICWISIWDGYFTVSFYLNKKDDEAVAGLDVSQSIKDTYAALPESVKMKPIIIEVRNKKDLKDIYPIFEYKWNK